jgi:thioredoxin-dependent peroxiredoxin
MPAVGDPAPDLTLSDDRGSVHRLSDQRGRWVVLYFYPKDDTPGCTVEACEFRDANEDLLARDAVVWGVSPQGAASKARFRGKYGLPFDLLADEDHAVAEAYGTWVEKESQGKRYWGTRRSTFLIGPDGRVRRTWEQVTPQGHASEVLRAIEEEAAGSGGQGNEASPAGGDE